jgi:2'-5' RNA ligase
VGNTLSSLQKGLVAVLGQYEYYEAASANWERDFRPHITIARNLSPAMLIKAESELPTGDYPEGVIKEITLVAVNKVDPKEAEKPENLTNFSL